MKATATKTRPRGEGKEEKLERGAILFLRMLLASGIPQKRLISISEHDYWGPFTLAALHAMIYRMETLTLQGIPSRESFDPVLLGWKMEAAKEAWCGSPGYVTKQGNNFPWTPWTDLRQPACGSASCSIIVPVREKAETFGHILQEASRFEVDTESFIETASDNKGHCFCLQHALQILDELCTGVRGFALRKAGLLSATSLSAGQSIVVPVRFEDFGNREFMDKPTSSKPAQGLMVVQLLRNCRIDEKSRDGARLEFIPLKESMDFLVHQGSIVCLNNWQWERRQRVS